MFIKIQHFLYPIFLFTVVTSCREKCESNPVRSDLTADALKWVEVSNTTPKFKITIENNDGTTTLDTIQGEYTLTIKDGPQAEDECEQLIQYKVYTNWLSLPYDSSNYGASFQLDNFLESGYRGRINGNSLLLDKNTILDTALINGKIFYNVFKDFSFSPYYTYYYAKEIGFILINKTDNSFSPKYSIELIN